MHVQFLTEVFVVLLVYMVHIVKLIELITLKVTIRVPLKSVPTNSHDSIMGRFVPYVHVIMY